jgi:cell wall-associated NlpC family hydrolase
VRKALLGAGLVFGACLAFLALLVVGVYSAAGSLASSSGAALATGAVPAAYAGLVEEWGSLCAALSPPVLAAQLYQESGWNPEARSGADAEGIAQFLPSTWATHGIDGNGDGKRDIWDPQDAIPSAASYDCQLAGYVKNVPGSRTENMLAAYNAGAYRVIKANGIPDIAETQHYVRSIMALAQSFTATTSVAASEQAAAAIYYAQQRLGTPYLWGGTGTAAEGGRFDCSGLTQAAYRSVGISLPRVASDQYNAGPHPSRAQLLPGDLVFFAYDLDDPRTIHHVGIYVGGGWMINAPHTGAVIRYDKIDTADYFGATRVTQDGAAALPRHGSAK